MKRLAAIAALAFGLSGCREVRVNTFSQGRTQVTGGGNQILVVRDDRALESVLDTKFPVRFRHEFGVVLLMGPHASTGYRQVIESIRANSDRIRIVAFERAPADGGEPSAEYRTYTLWIVPNSVYRSGSTLDVVTPEGEPIASAILK
jgi:hypothetical protein